MFGADVPAWRIGVYSTASSDAELEVVQWVIPLMEQWIEVKQQYTEEERALWKSRQERLAQLEQQSKLHAAIGSEDQQKIEQAQAPATADIGQQVPQAIEFVTVAANPALQYLFTQANDSFMQLLGQREDLMGILVVWPQLMDNLVRLRIGYHDLAHGSYTVLFDQIAPQKDAQELRDALLLAVSQVSNASDAGMLRIINGVPGIGLSINGTSYAVLDGISIVPAGQMSVTISAYGYESRTVDVYLEPRMQLDLDGTLSRKSAGPLSVSSGMGSVSWFFNGLRQEQLPFLIDNQTLPFNIVASKEGFISSAWQSTVPMRSIEFDLKPLWMTEENLIIRGKNKMYAAMGRSLGMFGVWVAMQALRSTYADSSTIASWNPWVFLSGSAAIVSVVDLFGSLVDYYTYTKYSNSR